MVLRDDRSGMEELNKYGQNVQISSYKINKNWDIMDNMVTIVNISVWCF